MSKINSILIALAFAATGQAAMADVYLNTEVNSGWVGSDYKAATTDFHVGFEAASNRGAFYIQAGPSLVAVDGIDNETEFSGKTGGSIAITEKLSGYGELSFITGDDDNSYGGKLGAKYVF